MQLKRNLKLFLLSLLILSACNSSKKISVGMNIEEVKTLLQDKKQIALAKSYEEGYSSFDIEFPKSRFVSFTYNVKDGKVVKIFVCENADEAKGKQMWQSLNEISF